MPKIERLGTINFIGAISKDKNISAIDLSGDFIVIGSDEGNEVQVLQHEGKDYKLIRKIILNKDAGEIDIEGIACKGSEVYVVGSHSYKREKLKAENAYDQNLLAMQQPLPQPDRDRLCRFTLDSEGNTRVVEETSLRPLLDHNKTLQTFSRIPSKENGIDIEGLAVHQEHLYVGFRGPVLRGNWVPVLKCQFATPVTATELLFVNLDGQGFRDITRVNDGFLILSGPMGDEPGAYHLHFWDGEDCLPRRVGSVGQNNLLGEIPTPNSLKAEGIALLKESDSAYEVIVVYDQGKNGEPTRFRVAKV